MIFYQCLIEVDHDGKITTKSVNVMDNDYL